MTTGNWQKQPWSGVYAATLCAFHDDETIDREGLIRYFTQVGGVPGIRGLVCNGHTGEIMSLRGRERAEVTRLCREAVDQAGLSTKVISGVSADGSLEAIDHAIEAREAGADAILLMPPHHWLRFGRNEATAVGFIRDVAEGAGLPVIVHQYPSWTKAGYSLKEMLEMVSIPGVVSIKMGTRDMARWRFDYESLKTAAPRVSIITCHDEYLLPTLVDGGDGALIGFAGFAPELMVELVHAILDSDLVRAKKAQQMVAPLARVIYDFGEPGCEAHQRMKNALWLMGKFSSPMVRRPLRPLGAVQIERLRMGLQAIGVDCPIKPTARVRANGSVHEGLASSVRRPRAAAGTIR